VRIGSNLQVQVLACVVRLILFDCSYPYEYEGGHIKGAKNIYTKEHILKEFVDMKQPEQNPAQQNDMSVSKKRNILIFHCEFSSERGPNL
jgi:M-phase inducer phosphatase